MCDGSRINRERWVGVAMQKATLVGFGTTGRNGSACRSRLPLPLQPKSLGGRAAEGESGIVGGARLRCAACPAQQIGTPAWKGR
jgi:hypothetical protein